MKKKIRRYTKFRMTLAFLCFGIVLSTLGYTCYGYLNKINRINKEKQQLTVDIESLKKKKESLETDIKKLSDPEYIAKYAREKYLYSKEGEYIIRLPE